MAEQKPKPKPTCYTCGYEIVFDRNITSPTSGKMIPLNPDTKKPHECKQETQTDQSETETQTEISRKNEEKIKQQNGKTQPATVTEIKTEYVDHTLAKPSEVKIFYSDMESKVEEEYKQFQIGKKFAWSRAQFQMSEDGFAIAFYYEVAT